MLRIIIIIKENVNYLWTTRNILYVYIEYDKYDINKNDDLITIILIGIHDISPMGVGR